MLMTRIIGGIAFLVILAVFMGSLVVASPGKASAADPRENRYLQMSIRQPLQVKITLVSNREEKPSDATAAVFLLSWKNIPPSWPPCVEFSLTS